MPPKLTEMQGKDYDVVVIGAGINGTSAARELAIAGYSILLVDKDDFAAGASSRSSRILHCGLRYFETPNPVRTFARHPGRLAGALRMARASMEARAELVSLAPERCKPFTMCFPTYPESAIKDWHLDVGFHILHGDVLIYDGTGRHPGPLAAEQARGAGAEVEYVSIDAQLSEELTYAERLRWKKRFLQIGVAPVFESRLFAVQRKDNRLEARFINEISREVKTVLVDQVVVEQGSIPMDEVYFGLRTQSANDGVTDLDAMVSATPQPRLRENGFELHRIGDAVSSRNIHAAVLDALRICSAL